MRGTADCGEADLSPRREKVGSGFANLRPRRLPRSSELATDDARGLFWLALAISSTQRDVAFAARGELLTEAEAEVVALEEGRVRAISLGSIRERRE